MVVKIGGRFAEDDTLIAALADEIAGLTQAGERILLVHGGGATISELQGRYGVSPRFVDGIRQTAPEEMPLVDMALAGGVNKRIVRLLESRGVASWGLSGTDGRTIIGECPAGSPETDRTGKVISVSTAAVKHLWSGGWVPVLAPPSTDSAFRGININADEAALAMATALKSDHLIFLSDVPGVLHRGEPIPRLTPARAEEFIGNTVISGGMIPKVRSATLALTRGVGAVHIGEYTVPGDLTRIVSGTRGTEIVRELNTHGC